VGDVQIFPMRPFAAVPIAGAERKVEHPIMMRGLPPLQLSGGEHLELIRRLDGRHQWHSLRDERYCTACHETFSADEVAIVGGTRAFGPLRLQCPSYGCYASPDEWLPVGDQRPRRKMAAAMEPNATHKGHALRVRRLLKKPRPVEGTSSSAGVVRRTSTLRKLAAKWRMLPLPAQNGGIFCAQPPKGIA
jgi:hypothetical protein